MRVPENFSNLLPLMSPTTDSRQDEDEDGPPPSTSQAHEKANTIMDLVERAKKQGRGIRRLVTLCGTITQLVVENDRRSTAGEIDDCDDDDGGGNDDDSDNDSPERREEMKRCVSHG
jgi:hypothetical protein